MKKVIERWLPTLKGIFKTLVLVLIAIFLIIMVCRDLDSRDGGYIRPVVSVITVTGMSCYSDAVETANTPLASLTIAKIFLLICYCIAVRFIVMFIMFIYGICSLINGFLKGDQQEKNHDY